MAIFNNTKLSELVRTNQKIADKNREGDQEAVSSAQVTQAATLEVGIAVIKKGKVTGGKTRGQQSKRSEGLNAAINEADRRMEELLNRTPSSEEVIAWLEENTPLETDTAHTVSVVDGCLEQEPKDGSRPINLKATFRSKLSKLRNLK